MVPKPSVFPQTLFNGFERGTFIFIHFDPKDMFKIKPNVSKGIVSMVSKEILSMVSKGVFKGFK